ncbi:MAG: DUF5640 domain-containing protein [Faecalibacterium sp.]|nr:DUF5640 domain-containing protein [Ruminococcus sp.]MCM1392634.1 DUF5640 domain-containing protein [Ruminococcus sp.]MCM1486059.1 DUF5640 domain-containing protein [Faecalibacterium sp.]
MKNSTKIMIIVVSAVLALCIIITACVGISKKNDNKPIETVPETTLQSFFGASNANSTDSVSAPVVGDTQQNIDASLPTAIIGKWTDSANMSGYEFFGDGSVSVTYVNLTVPVINVPINGSTKGTYTINGNTVTVKFSIYSKTISKSFSASVENNSLTLKDLEDGDVATYERASASDTETTVAYTSGAAATQTGITGGWESSDGTWKYTFNEDGTVRVTLKNVRIPFISADSLTGSYNGIYMTDDDEITIQFMVNDKKVTLEYDYKISGNTLSFEDSHDDVILFVRGAGAVSANAGDLIGKWSDGSGMSGYEFKQDGTVNITYVNFTVPVINMPINGTYAGTYTIKGNKITINASIYSKTITNTYTFSVQGNTLTLEAEDGGISTYSKK